MGQNQLGPTDAFNGTNTNTLHTYDANWDAVCADFGDHVIAGTPGVGSFGNCVSKNTGQTWTVNQWCELKVDATNIADQRFAICTRILVNVTSFDGYAAGAFPGSIDSHYRIVKVTAGSISTLIADAGPNIANDDVVNFEVNGITLTMRKNGSVLLTVDDPTFSTGNVGLALHDTVSTKRLGGTWKAGSVTSDSSAILHPGSVM